MCEAGHSAIEQSGKASLTVGLDRNGETADVEGRCSAIVFSFGRSVMFFCDVAREFPVGRWCCSMTSHLCLITAILGACWRGGVSG